MEVVPEDPVQLPVSLVRRRESLLNDVHALAEGEQPRAHEVQEAYRQKVCWRPTRRNH